MEPASCQCQEADALPDDVLVVEDDAIIAMDFGDAIRSLGVKTVRLAANIAEAIRLIAERPPAFALLDVGLRSESGLVIAERLDKLGIPFAIVTGHRCDASLLGRFISRPLLSKPYSMKALKAILTSWLQPPQ